MDTINVDGKLYDPYFILGVTKEDSNDHITKAFRKKVKKYHPDKYIDKTDKKKYECYFKILVESFEYIKEKRTGKKSIHVIDKSKYKHEVKKDKEKSQTEFNKEFDSKMKINDPNDHGYGENYSTMKSVKDYDNLEINNVNLFGKQKFSNKKFNKMFEWHKQQHDKEKEKTSNQLIHRTTDGFYGYNSASVDNCSLVSSYNGLMIVGDDLGEKGIGYWGDNYSDYYWAHNNVKNPSKKVRIPRHFKGEVDEEELINKNKAKDKREDMEEVFKSKSFHDEKNLLYKKQYDELLEKERSDKELVMKYIHKYKQSITDAALNNELEQSQTYVDVLQKYIREN